MDYASIASETSAAIKEAGAAVKLTNPGEGVYDSATSTVSTFPRTHDGFAVQGNYTTRDIDGTNILSGDTRLLVAVDGLSGPMPRPMPGYTIEFAGQSFRVVRSTPVQPGGVPVLWDTQARQ